MIFVTARFAIKKLLADELRVDQFVYVFLEKRARQMQTNKLIKGIIKATLKFIYDISYWQREWNHLHDLKYTVMGTCADVFTSGICWIMCIPLQFKQTIFKANQ